MPNEPRSTPPAPSPRPGRNPGYDEAQARDRRDLGHPDGKLPNPEAGGLRRDQGDAPDTADDD